MNKIYGVPASPYVRKAMLAHGYKGVAYDLVITMPGSDDQDFREASPLGKIPAYRTEAGYGFADSSVIIAYLERTEQAKPLYPEDNNDFAQALWFEEYADTKMMEATAALYFQRVIGPKYFSHQTDEERVVDLCTNLIPATLDFVEQKLADNEWLAANQLTVADITLIANLFNLHHADFEISSERWPNVAQYREKVWQLDFVQQQLNAEQQMLNG